jgi:hypothetical protein
MSTCVPKATYVKMVNADSPGRFAKRHILNFTWRKQNKPRLDLIITKALLIRSAFNCK